LAAYLKVSDSTISRWENGRQIQQLAMDLLLRGYFNVRELRLYFAALSGLLPPPADIMVHHYVPSGYEATNTVLNLGETRHFPAINQRFELPPLPYYSEGWLLEYRPEQHDPSADWSRKL